MGHQQQLHIKSYLNRFAQNKTVRLSHEEKLAGQLLVSRAWLGFEVNLFLT